MTCAKIAKKGANVKPQDLTLRSLAVAGLAIDLLSSVHIREKCALCSGGLLSWLLLGRRCAGPGEQRQHKDCQDKSLGRFHTFLPFPLFLWDRLRVPRQLRAHQIDVFL